MSSFLRKKLDIYSLIIINTFSISFLFVDAELLSFVFWIKWDDVQHLLTHLLLVLVFVNVELFTFIIW